MKNQLQLQKIIPMLFQVGRGKLRAVLMQFWYSKEPLKNLGDDWPIILPI